MHLFKTYAVFLTFLFFLSLIFNDFSTNFLLFYSDLKADPDAIAAVLQSPSAGSQRLAEVTAAITTTPSKVRGML